METSLSLAEDFVLETLDKVHESYEGTLDLVGLEQTDCVPTLVKDRHDRIWRLKAVVTEYRSGDSTLVATYES